MAVPLPVGIGGRWLLLALLACATRAAEVAVDAKGAQEETNPHSASGDSTQECYAWAADGQCTQNAGHMLSSCKYSCWEWFEHRRKKYPDAPIDKSMDCFNWAKDGEYARTRARARCCRALSLLFLPSSAAAQTRRRRCRRRCGKNPAYMKSTCPEACKDKGYDPPPPPPGPADSSKKKKKRKKKAKKASADKDEV